MRSIHVFSLEWGFCGVNLVDIVIEGEKNQCPMKGSAGYK